MAPGPSWKGPKSAMSGLSLEFQHSLVPTFCSKGAQPTISILQSSSPEGLSIPLKNRRTSVALLGQAGILRTVFIIGQVEA